MTYSIVLVEGVRDRAFWAGWLLQNGWQDARDRDKDNVARDPFGKSVSGDGKFAYYGVNEAFVLVVPCLGESRIDAKFEHYVGVVYDKIQKESEVYTYRLIVCVDADIDDTQSEMNPTKNRDAVSLLVGKAEAYILRKKGEAEPKKILPVSPDANGNWSLFDSRCSVQVVRWQTDTPLAQGIPTKQTLERLVCSAICEAYPERLQEVALWLTDKSENPKAYAWSHMAGWYADHGCDDFYKEIWREEKVRPLLERKLNEIGAWEVFASLSHPNLT